jgi:pimeloyl-ACP methyl ester carboxylesterase/DNA-binding CsgD family transcriptional regulator
MSSNDDRAARQRATTIEDRLRDGLAQGRTADALLDDWLTLEAFAISSEASLIAILEAAATLPSAIGVAALTARESIGLAVVGTRAAGAHADQSFRLWIGEVQDSIACRRLIRSARAKGKAIGVVETAQHGVLAVLAVTRRNANKWIALAPDVPLSTPDDVVLVAFAPSRSAELVQRAARSLGLNDLEARLTGALIAASSLDEAARELGISRDMAKTALSAAMRKTGAERSSQLVGRLVDLTSDATAPLDLRQEISTSTLGLSAAEMRVARLLAQGITAKAVGETLTLTTETVKSYRRSIFSKTGISRVRDLHRLLAEFSGLERLDLAAEVASDRIEGGGELRTAAGPHGRRVAMIDYGPADGEPILLMHGYTTGRLAAPPFRRALQRAGHRVIVPQRPGFGLTSAAIGDYVETAAEDMALALDRLGLAKASVIARDGGAAAAIEFGSRFPERLARRLLVNPRPPREVRRGNATPIAAISAMLLRHPALLRSFGGALMRQTRGDILKSLLQRVYRSFEADRVAFADPVVADYLMADLRGQVGRTIDGWVAENRLFTDGWRPPLHTNAPRWTIAISGDLWAEYPREPWSGIIAGPLHTIDKAGLLVQFTHPEALLTLLS